MTKHLNIDDTNILDDSAEVLDRGGISFILRIRYMVLVLMPEIKTRSIK